MSLIQNVIINVNPVTKDNKKKGELSRILIIFIFSLIVIAKITKYIAL